MGKRGVGALLCLTAGILFSARYVTAAIYTSGQGVPSLDPIFFASVLACVGGPLLTLGILFLIAGVGYLVWAEVIDQRSNPKATKSPMDNINL